MNAYALSQSLRILSKWWPEGGLFTMPVAIAAAIVAAILVGIFASLRSGNSKKQGPVPASEEFAPEGAAAHPKTPSKLQSASLHEKTSPVTKSPPSVSTTIPASPTSPASATTSPLKATSLDKGTATTVETPSPAAMVDFLLNTVKVSKRDLTAAMKYSGDNGERDLKTFLDGRGEQVATRTQDLTTYYVEQASKWARAEVDELLSQHAVSKADISAALGYSGHNGVRDVATFLEGRATDLHAKREKLREFAAVARDRSSKATPVKPAAPVTKESSPKTESKATAAKPPSPTEATPKTTTTAASPAKPLASVEKSAATKVDAASAEKVTFLLEVLLRSKSDVTKAIGYSGNSGPRDLDAFLEGKCEDLENRKAKLDAYYDVEATAWAAAEVKRLVEVEGVSAADLSAAIGYSGSHGVRDLAVFTEGRAKDIETRRRKLRDFIQARAKSANPCADGKKPTPAPLTNQEMVDHLTKVKGISLADISVALGYSGKHGQRDVDSFLEGRSKELEERSQKLKVFYDSHA